MTDDLAINPKPSISARDEGIVASTDTGLGFVDLLVLLRRHRLFLMAAALVGLAIGLTVALMSKRIYSYTTVIEIGKGEVPIETPEASIARITSAFLPIAQRAHGPDQDHPLTIDVDLRNPRGSNLITMTSKSGTDAESALVALHAEIFDMLYQDHKRQLEAYLRDLEASLAREKRKAGEVKDRIASIGLQKQLVEEYRHLAETRLKEINVQLAQSEANREAAGKAVAGSDQALTLMMIDGELGKARAERAALEERLRVGLVQEAERWGKEASDAARSLSEQEAQIAQLQYKIDNIRQTRQILAPMRSMWPVGMGRTGMALLGLFAGLSIGIIRVLIADSLKSRALGLGRAFGGPNAHGDSA